MARKKLSEFKAKQILTGALNTDYHGISLDTTQDLKSQLAQIDPTETYALKVDQGVKGRMKKGLVLLNLEGHRIEESLAPLEEKGYTQFLAEPMMDLKDGEEKYLSLERTRNGIKILYSEKGGINVEDSDSVKEFYPENANEISLPNDQLQKILQVFDNLHFSFLEINPLIVRGDTLYLLDTAVEVDSAGEFFAGGEWTERDFVEHDAGSKTEEEINVKKLADNSQASFNLTVLNPNGRVFLLLSGGGASIVVADEVAALGCGHDLANYGEYSGNPNTEETYIYTRNLLSLMLKSEAKDKTLILAGGVANFTDVARTFQGIIRAFDDVKKELADQGIKVYVRRGGPNQKAGLAQMKDYLEKNNLLGKVSGPEMVLTEIVHHALK